MALCPSCIGLGKGLSLNNNTSNIMNINARSVSIEHIGCPAIKEDVDREKEVGSREERERRVECRLFSEEVEPLLISLRLSGVLPIFKSTTGWRFRRISLWSLYSLSHYLFFTPITFQVMLKLYTIFRETNVFDEKLFLVIIGVLLLPYCVIPVTNWRGAPDIADYINSWDKFQILYNKTTGQRVNLNLRKKMLIPRTLVFILAFTNVFVGPNDPLNLSVSERLSCAFNGYIVNTTLLLTVVSINAVGQVGQHLHLCFKKEISQDSISYETIHKYKQLWLNLSDLATATGLVTYRISLLPILITAAFAALSLYGSSLSLFNNDFKMSFCFGIGSLIFLFTMYLYCDQGHWAPIKIKQTEKQLQNLDLQNTSVLFSQEVKGFLATIHMNEPVIACGGFYNINRSTLHAICATVVTYLVVILQFRVTLTPDTETITNATTVDLFFI